MNLKQWDRPKYIINANAKRFCRQHLNISNVGPGPRQIVTLEGVTKGERRNPQDSAVVYELCDVMRCVICLAVVIP